MNVRETVRPGTHVTSTWHVDEQVREEAAPELISCELFSSTLDFDRTALTLAAGMDEAWALRGSDAQLQRLLMQEQTVLQGPNTEALRAAVGVNVTDVHGVASRWPMLHETGVLDDASYRCLLVVPLDGSVRVPPIGTFCVARDSPRPFTQSETARVVRFSRVLAGLMLFRWQSAHEVDRFDGLVLDQRHVAAGMLASCWAWVRRRPSPCSGQGRSPRGSPWPSCRATSSRHWPRRAHRRRRLTTRAAIPHRAWHRGQAALRRPARHLADRVTSRLRPEG